MEINMDPAVWQEHIDQDIQQSKDIAQIKMALFGCQAKPETMKHALMPTMQRINNYLDVMRWIGGITAGLVLASPIWIPQLRTIIKMLT